MAMSLQIRVQKLVGAWLAVLQTQWNNSMKFFWIIKLLFLTINVINSPIFQHYGTPIGTQRHES